MATTHIDYRKIDYDQLIDKPITRVASSVNPNTLTTAGVYDRGDGNRFIVTVDGQNILQVIEKKDGYETRSSTDGGTTWSAWDTIEFTKSGDIDAEDVNYDNTTSGLTATNVQDAIDEMNEVVEEIKDIVEVEEMPTPSEENEGTIIQYKGETTSDFTHWYFYECVGDGQDPETFSRVNIQVQDNPSQAEVMPTPSAENVGQIIQYVGDTNNYYTHAHFYEVIEDPENPGQYIYKEVEVQDSPAQSEDMPEADEDSVGKIIQYIWETDANFTHWYFYECVSDGEDPATYSWVRIDVQPAGAWDDHEFITLTAYNQLTPTQKAEKVYMITEDGVAPTPTDINAEDVNYDNTVSWLNADNVQDAIDEIKDSVDTLKEKVEQSTTFKWDILLWKMFWVSDTQGFFWDKTVNGSQRMYSLKKTTWESVYNFAVNSDDVNLFIRNWYAYEIRGAGTYIVKRIKLDDMTTETTNAGSSGSLSYIESKITDAIYIRTSTSNYEYLKVELDLTTSRISSSDYSTTPIGRYYNDKMYLNSSSNVYERSLDWTVIRTINNTGTVNGIYNWIIEKTYWDVSYGIFNVNL